MAVSTHLKIEISEYDERIRTFIPDYEEMLDVAAAALKAAARPLRVLLDLGTGTGALATRCAASVPGAAIVGIDADESMLALAKRRSGMKGAMLLHGDFTRTPFPRCEVITAAFALHHIPTRRRKAALYARGFSALRPGGLLVNADCCLAGNARLAALDRLAWRAHLEKAYGRRQAEAFLRAWAGEDVYFRLADELSMLRSAGFITDVVWRRGSFAVIAAARPTRSRSPIRHR